FEKEETADMTYALERAIDEIERRGIRKGKREGELKGKREGELKGKREGKLEGKLETAKAALAKGFTVRDVADITGIDEETVRKLKADAVM
ncbi:MAG: transposase, partial [Clostridiales Family XIII bacterium]|nr:transposase [Clostridiales Family XIII bacterium]